MKQNWNKSPKKRETARGRHPTRPCQGSTAAHAQAHGRAPGARLAVHWCASQLLFCLGCTAVHPCGMSVRVPFSAVLLSWMLGASSNF